MLNRILVPLDGSVLAECVLPYAVSMARVSNGRIVLLRVLERSETVNLLEWHLSKAEVKAYLDGVSNRLNEAGFQTETVLLEGRATDRVIEYVHSNPVDLLVLSSHGASGLSGWNVSSMVQKTIIRACVPTLIVRAYQIQTSDLTGLSYKRLLAPLDCSIRAECVFPYVNALAKYYEAGTLVVNVVSKPEMPARIPLRQDEIDLMNRIIDRNREEATRYFRQIQNVLEVKADMRVITGDHPAGTLHDLAAREGVDLVILSAHGNSGGDKWPYGSMTVNFLAYGTTPLLIVQDLSQDEFQTMLMEITSRDNKGH